MSTFNGTVKEIPDIAVDNFEDNSLKCYFLSHCHSDHMKSLETLAHITAPLYTTQLSEKIVRQRYPSINVQVLEHGYPQNIEFTRDDGTDVTFIVTALNSTGHCLGACMFLFQVEGLDVLYTGDFRMTLAHAKNIKVLNDIRSYNKLILYLDTTFMSDSYKYFPSQSESCSKVIEIVKQHLKGSSSHKGTVLFSNVQYDFFKCNLFPVVLQTSARYGYERLLIQIYKELKEQIYINEQQVFELYSIISDLTTCVTSDKLKARISLKPSFMANEISEDSNTLTIQLSAMYWKNWMKGTDFSTKIEGKNLIRVCYATHNSCSELEDFVTFLEPKCINATVIPNNFTEKELMMALIRRMYKKFVREQEPEKKKKFTFKRLYSSDESYCERNDNRSKILKK